MSHLCVLDHQDDAEALPGLRLCRHHRRWLDRDLTGLPALHARLATVLPTATGGGGAGPVSGTSSAPLPINPAVAEVRDQIRHDLVWWCLFTAEHRGIAALPDNRVPDVAAWLARHAEWIAGHAVAAAECPPVMRDLAQRAHSLLNPSGAKRIRVGACHDATEDGPCRGVLWATCRAEDDVRPSEIYCDGPCGTRKGPEEWRRFGREYLKGRMVS